MKFKGPWPIKTWQAICRTCNYRSNKWQAWHKISRTSRDKIIYHHKKTDRYHRVLIIEEK